MSATQTPAQLESSIAILSSVIAREESKRRPSQKRLNELYTIVSHKEAELTEALAAAPERGAWLAAHGYGR